jgi:hypothetical protein
MRKLTQILIALVLVGLPAVARAQAKAPAEQLVTRYGMAAYAGGGVGGFTDDTLRDLTGTAGIWEARVAFGTRLPFSLELGYLGGLQEITAQGLGEDAALLTTTVEGAVRANAMAGPFTGYIFGGLGWSRFTLTEAENTGAIVDIEDDDVLTVPMGVGMSYQVGRVIADLRGTYRATAGEDLVPDGDDEPRDLSSWNAALHVGFEF